MFTPFKTQDFNNQLLRTLGKAAWRSASLGECEAVTARIEDGQVDTWLAAWRDMADRVADEAASSRDGGHAVSARDGFLRAAEYYRQATFFHRVDLDNPDLQAGWRRARTCFIAAFEAGGHALTPCEIPFDGGLLFGYFLPAGAAAEPAPLLIVPSGYDGTAEEMAITGGLPALSRGYHVLLVDGPGQGRTLYDQESRLFMRPDWENVLPSIVDFAIAEPGVDADRIAALGISFGGYLVPRGVSGDPRIAALIADPGQFDIGGAVTALLPEKLTAVLETETAEADAAFLPLLESPSNRLLFLPRMAAHGRTSLRAYLQDCLRYTMVDHAGRIRCPALVCDNETDPISTGQGARLAAALGGPVTSVRFTAAEGAAGHCEGVGREVFEQRALDWLAAVFDRRPAG